MLKIFGIAIKFHFSWFFAIALVIWSLSTSYFPSLAPNFPIGVAWFSGIVTSLMIFASVLFHELAHCMMARARGVHVNEIMLHIFGGVSKLEKEISDYKTEFLVATAGPMASLAAGIFFYSYGDGPASRYVAVTNFILFGFNFIPAFPLDGGRIFRSLVWAYTKDFVKATSTAAKLGVKISSALVALGIIFIFGGISSGIWLLIMGGLLLMIGDNTYKQLRGVKNLSVKVSEVMIPAEEVKQIPAGLPLDVFYKKYFITYGFTNFPVVDNGQVIGYLNSKKLFQNGDYITFDIYMTSLNQNRDKTAKDVMFPISEENSISPDTDLKKAFEKMLLTSNDRLFVFDGNNKFMGMLLKTSVIRMARIA